MSIQTMIQKVTAFNPMQNQLLNHFGSIFVLLLFGMAPLCSEPLQKPASSMPEAIFELTRIQTDEDEIKIVDQLISSTKRLLQYQERLKDLMVQFQKYKEEFSQGNQTKAHTARLVRLGREIYELIKTEHFEHLFAKDYLDELQFFSSIAGKNSLGKQ